MCENRNMGTIYAISLEPFTQAEPAGTYMCYDLSYVFL